MLIGTDSKGGYDAICNSESGDLGLKSARTAIEAYALKLIFNRAGNNLAWFDSSWNLADAMTKNKADCREELKRFLQTWRWRIRFDEHFVVSAKKAPKKATKILEDEAVGT